MAQHALSKGFWYDITHKSRMTKEEYLGMINKITLFISIVFILSLVVFIVLAYLGNFDAVVSTMLSANLLIYSLAFVAVFFAIALKFGKWSYYLKILKVRVSAKKSFPAYTSMYSMDLTPGKIGRVVAAYTMNRISNMRFISILPIVTLDIFTDFLGSAILALLVAIYMNQFIIEVFIVDVVLLIPFLFLLHPWFYDMLKKLIKKSKYFRMFSIYGDEYFLAQNRLNKFSVYFVSLVFTLPAAFLISSAMYFSILSIGIHPQLSQSVFVFSISDVIGMVSTLPGQIGATDGSMIALLGSIMHLSAATSSAVTIMTRIASLWFGLLVGGIALFYTIRFWNPKPGELKSKRTRKRR